MSERNEDTVEEFSRAWKVRSSVEHNTKIGILFDHLVEFPQESFLITQWQIGSIHLVPIC